MKRYKYYFIFGFLFIVVLIAYHTLFNSYFESDEWFYLTYYLPLTHQPFGFLTAFFSIFTKASYISGGQHVVPIASLIYYLNTKFFGLNFFPYAFMALLFHAINSFLVFTFTEILFRKKPTFKKNAYALLGASFFALSPLPMHAFTGFAAFYGQNVLSVTFFLLCVISFELFLQQGKKKFVFLSVLFLFLALFTQESTVFLFFVLPIMLLPKKKNVSYKFLAKLFIPCFIFYVTLRFIIPNIPTLKATFENALIPASYNLQTTKHSAGSPDLSIYKNLPGELLFRSIVFPIRMTGSIFIPRETLFTFVQIIAPIISPIPPGGDNVNQSSFLNYSGNSVIIYFVGLLIIIFCLYAAIGLANKKYCEDAHALLVGLAIIVFGALPLVAIIFSFPLWGYDIYFDSRHYYNPNVGAAILFPFLLLCTSRFIAKIFQTKKILLIALVLLILGTIANVYAFTNEIHINTQNYSVDRKEIVEQLTTYLPRLRPITVFYFGTDGKSPFVSLPFFTSVPQALSVVYFNRNGLPDSFYNKPLFAGKPQGYEYADGRGFGYYIAKKDLTEAILTNKFSIANVYGFYYLGEEAKIKNITPEIRKELITYKQTAKQNDGWQKFTDIDASFFLLHPPETLAVQQNNFIEITGQNMEAKLFFIQVPQTFDLNSYVNLQKNFSQATLSQKKLVFDTYHFNNAYVLQDDLNTTYYFQLGNTLFYLNSDNSNTTTLEKILGSIQVTSL